MVPAIATYNVIHRLPQLNEAESKSGSQCKKRKDLKIGANEEFSKILVEWCQQMRADTVSIDGPGLCAEAVGIALWLYVDSFEASNGW
jgi:hypothetical protein